MKCGKTWKENVLVALSYKVNWVRLECDKHFTENSNISQNVVISVSVLFLFIYLFIYLLIIIIIIILFCFWGGFKTNYHIAW